MCLRVQCCSSSTNGFTCKIFAQIKIHRQPNRMALSYAQSTHINIPEKNDFLVWLRTWVEQVISLETVIMSRGAFSIVYSLQKWIPLYIRFTLNIWIGKQIDAPLKLSTADQVEEGRPPAHTGMVHTHDQECILQLEHFHTEETIKCHIDTFCITNCFIPLQTMCARFEFEQNVFAYHGSICCYSNPT